MSSESAAFTAAQAKHHRYMLHFKKQRYIEVFQCSGDDMNLVLTGSPSKGPMPLQQPLLLPSGPPSMYPLLPLLPGLPQGLYNGVVGVPQGLLLQSKRRWEEAFGDGSCGAGFKVARR